MSNISYSSISEIHSALLHHDHTPKELFDYLVECYTNWRKDNSKDKIVGSEVDYHNLSVEFSRQNCEPYASAVAAIGVEDYPLSTDLIADQIKYSQETGNKERCNIGMEALKKIDRKYWTWRTFVFAIDFLKDGLSSSDSVKAYEEGLVTAREFIADFKKYIPHEERAYVAEAELLQNVGNYDEAIKSLEKGIEKISVAPQCCLKIADMMLERGEYTKVEEYARKGILMATQDQPSVSVGYLYYLLALAMDANRIQARQNGSLVEDTQIRKIVNAFQTADRLLLNEGRKDVSYRRTIKAKLIILEMEENITIEVGYSDAKDTSSEKQPNLADLLQIKNMLESN